MRKAIAPSMTYGRSCGVLTGSMRRGNARRPWMKDCWSRSWATRQPGGACCVGALRHEREHICIHSYSLQSGWKRKAGGTTRGTSIEKSPRMTSLAAKTRPRFPLSPAQDMVKFTYTTWRDATMAATTAAIISSIAARTASMPSCPRRSSPPAPEAPAWTGVQDSAARVYRWAYRPMTGQQRRGNAPAGICPRLRAQHQQFRPQALITQCD
jgi:hypothetical protein